MLFRLAVGNVRRSLRDYAVYFVTLALGVAVFYAFNTIAGQAAFLSEDARAMVQAVSLIMRLVTVFLALVLGFLMVYANNYLVRRRKRELGLYQLLGMTRAQVSLVLSTETLLASLASLAVGFATGILLSQLLVFVTAALFDETVTEFSFHFSGEAALLTLCCFVLMFSVMLAFNLRTLRKVRLIDLMGASRANERMRVSGLGATLLGTLVGVGLIAWSYVRLLRDGLPVISSLQYEGFLVTTGIVIIGTLVLFLSLSGLLLRIARAFRGSYYRGLNMFTVRQLSSRVRTVSLSMGIISLILFLAITSVSGGLGICAGLNDDLGRTTPYDVSLSLFYGDADEGEGTSYQYDAQAFFVGHGVDLSLVTDQLGVMPLYHAADVKGGDSLTIGGLSDRSGTNFAGSALIESNADIALELVPISGYNSARRACGLDDIELGEDRYLLASGVSDLLGGFYDGVLAAGTTVELQGRVLRPAGPKADDSEAAVIRNGEPAEGLCVVPDDLLEGALSYVVCTNFNYSVPVTEGDAFVEATVRSLGDEPEGAAAMLVVTRTETASNSRGASGIIAYLAIYIGFVLVIACAAILAIQQLSSTADAVPSYLLLSELGCPPPMVLRSLLAQTLIFFLLPLLVALAHGAVALSQVMQVMSMLGKVRWHLPVLASAVAFVAVYGSYLMVTYLMSRGIVSRRESRARG